MSKTIDPDDERVFEYGEKYQYSPEESIHEYIDATCPYCGSENARADSPERGRVEIWCEDCGIISRH